MTYTIHPKGVCSRRMEVELDDQNVIQSLNVTGGCDGNLKGIGALLQGMPAEEAARRLKGICCGGKETSCPDQLACGLEQLLAE